MNLELELFTVLKSLDFTSVVANRSWICFGPQTKYLFKDGSTSPLSKKYLVSNNLAIVNPSVCCAVENLDDDGNATAVAPATPVSAELLEL